MKHLTPIVSSTLLTLLLAGLTPQVATAEFVASGVENGADIGGYFRPDREKADGVMRPSSRFNRIIDSI